MRGLQQHSWLRYYATSMEAAGSIPNDVTEFFSIDLVLPAQEWP